MSARRTRRWLREHASDVYVKKAQADGLRSRAAYKLEQIDARDKLLRQGLRVVDLGAAPGGWAQYAARRVGPKGSVVALDTLPMQAIPGVRAVQGDIHDPVTLERIIGLLDGGQCDLVLSDMAPNMSGIRDVDAARCEALAFAALEFAGRILHEGGAFLIKSFHGPGLEGFLVAMRGRFATTLVRKPDASRARSREVYLLGRQYSV